MKKVEDFAGYLSSFQTDKNALSMRLTPWCDQYEETPVMIVKSENCMISSTDGLTLEFIHSNECEIDEIEFKGNKLSIWIYDYESPIVIEGEIIVTNYVSYNHEEYKNFMCSKDTQIEQGHKETLMLRKRLNTIESFVRQQEQRIIVKSVNHLKGTSGYKLYKDQLKLLSKLKNKLNK